MEGVEGEDQGELASLIALASTRERTAPSGLRLAQIKEDSGQENPSPPKRSRASDLLCHLARPKS